MSRLWKRRFTWLAGVALLWGATEAQATAAKDEAPLVILIKEGGRLPAQTLLRSPGRTATVVSYRLTGGATLSSGDGRHAVARFRDGRVSLPELVATKVGDEGDLVVVVDGKDVARHIRVATVSADHLLEARHLLGMSAADDVDASEPLIRSGVSGGNGSATLRATDESLVVDMAMVDRSSWSDQSEQVSIANRTPGKAGKAACIRTPFPPGWIEWQGLNPVANLYSVLPESSSSLVWGRAPSQDADALYNRYWGSNYAIKIPSHCTAYVWDNVCCCNAAASVFEGVCRPADFSGAESGWPRNPL